MVDPVVRSVKIPRSHLERELYKEMRREHMIPRLTRKSVMYDNIQLCNPDGMILATISKKKANWYVRKNLASWTDNEIDPVRIRLHFTPKIAERPSNTINSNTNTTALQQYNASFKENQCVGCGSTKEYMKHYIVPYIYRTQFPIHYKAHLPHDIVLLCPHCHLSAQQALQWRKQQLEYELRSTRKDLHRTSDQVFTIDTNLRGVKNAAVALLNWRDRLPIRQRNLYEERVHEWAKKNEYKHINEQPYKSTEATSKDSTCQWLDVLTAASQLESHIPNPNYVAGTDLVIDSLKKNSNGDTVFDEATLADFIRGWRQHFVVIVQPRYLPSGWSIEGPVHCDRRDD